jgi:hypothetical protein
MGFFDINYDTLRVQLLPVRLRKANMKAWTRCLVVPVKWLYNLFMASRTENLYFLAHNSQVVYLEGVLNDVFDPVSRGIYIEDGLYEDALFTYLDTESQPQWLGLVSEAGSTTYPVPQVLYTSAETATLGNAFVVNVPVAIVFDLNRMNALIDKYRIAGKNIYQVVTY